MARLDQIKSESPFFIDPAQHDLDCPGMMSTMKSPERIALLGQDAIAFRRWIEESWRKEFEQDLQSLFADENGKDLLSTFLPLVTFMDDVCVRSSAHEDEETAPLMDRLRQELRSWRAAGVDTIFISGFDAREPRN